MTTAPTAAVRSKPLRLGFLALTDAAPLVAAHEMGFFAQHGLNVELRREIGWATIREKIIYRELDAGPAPAPMLWSTLLGIGCPPTEVLTPLVLNRHGNALTLSQALWDAGGRDGSSLASLARSRRVRQPLTFGVVFPFSSHHLLLRDWLGAAGLDPERDVRIVIVPPAQMFRNLAAGTLDGYCAGEPWNTLAVREGVGWCPTWSAAQQPGHPEKVLMVTQRFTETRAPEHTALVRALNDAAAWCDESHHREQLAELLADARYLNLPARVVAPALVGRFDCGHGRVESVPDFHVFHRHGAGVPTLPQAVAIQAALGAAGLLSPAQAADTHLPRQLFREDLHRGILHSQAPYENTPTPNVRGIGSATR